MTIPDDLFDDDTAYILSRRLNTFDRKDANYAQMRIAQCLIYAHDKGLRPELREAYAAEIAEYIKNPDFDERKWEESHFPLVDYAPE